MREVTFSHHHHVRHAGVPREAVAPGTHINAALGICCAPEIDEATVRQPHRGRLAPERDKEAGDPLPGLVKGAHAGGLTELGEVIAGLRPGRTSPEQVTLFESQGMAMQDLIIAAELLKLARARGLGSEVDLGK